MTPTIGRILHVGYDLNGLKLDHLNGNLPCRAALVTGDLREDGTIPVTVFPPFTASVTAVVDLFTGWHDPRSCPRQQAVGANDGQPSTVEVMTGEYDAPNG